MHQERVSNVMLAAAGQLHVPPPTPSLLAMRRCEVRAVQEQQVAAQASRQTQNSLWEIPLTGGGRKWIKVHAGALEISINPEDDCAICWEQFNQPQVLACEHSFCKACIQEWLSQKNTCPLCRRNVVDAVEVAQGDDQGDDQDEVLCCCVCLGVSCIFCQAAGFVCVTGCSLKAILMLCLFG